MTISRGKGGTAVLCLGLTLAVLGAYANHFENGFHFDDVHTITDNAYLESLSAIPRFFTDATLFSTLPGQQSYRPVVSASLAADYWLGGGRKPFWFHLSTFLWFAVQLVLMFFLFRRIMDLADPHPTNIWAALLAAACYGLHPANAETLNYIIQRGDLYNTVGVVASVLWFAARPGQRRWGWYLIPAVLAFLSKAPALIYPFILLAYVFLFEQEGTLGRGHGKQWAAAVRATLPALAAAAVGAILTAAMTPATFQAGAASAALYRLTQPWVALHYFVSFFLPIQLSADMGWAYVSSPFSGEALAGYVFVAALAAAAVAASRRRETRPIAFGILWFILALLPTSLMPLADVTNDHRMFFPFVGLALAVAWSLRLALFRRTARLTVHRVWVRGGVAAAAVVLALAAAGTWERNQVWRTEETLWRDVTIKNPQNPRGLMNYSNALLSRRDYAEALSWMERARAVLPDNYLLEINLGVADGGLGRNAEAAAHFERAAALAPGDADPHVFYGRWLRSIGRQAEAQAQLETAVKLNPSSFAARQLLMQVYSESGNRAALERLVEETRRLAPDNQAVRRYLEPGSGQVTSDGATAADLLQLAGGLCKAGKNEECLEAAKKALVLRPDSPTAYNIMAAALTGLGRWDEGIAALQEALRLKPDYEAARRNLAWLLEQKQKAR
ncbi:MAG TPA: tetratricopeptide repeat protein [Bryobacteraceae bacterium]|nr:tetratricopeptide repeat protein [Bryobacteraceae bacterium]